MFQELNKCRFCGENPADNGNAAWDGFLCKNCFTDFEAETLALSMNSELDDLSGGQYEYELRKIGWKFHLDPEIVRQRIWEIKD